MSPEEFAEQLKILIGKSAIVLPSTKWIRSVTEVELKEKKGRKWVYLRWTPERNQTDRLSTDILDCGYSAWRDDLIKENGLAIIRSFSIVAKPKRHHRSAEPQKE